MDSYQTSFALPACVEALVKHITFSLPQPLVEEIEALVREGDNRWGYRTRAEFVSDAVRRRLDQCQEASGGWRKPPVERAADDEGAKRVKRK